MQGLTLFAKDGVGEVQMYFKKGMVLQLYYLSRESILQHLCIDLLCKFLLIALFAPSFIVTIEVSNFSCLFFLSVVYNRDPDMLVRTLRRLRRRVRMQLLDLCLFPLHTHYREDMFCTL